MCGWARSPMVVTTIGVMVTGLCGRETIVLEVVDTGTTSGDPKMMLHFIHLKYGQLLRNDDENSTWMPHNIKHVSEVTDDQVNRSVFITKITDWTFMF